MGETTGTPELSPIAILDAASVLLVDRSDTMPRVLMGLRRADNVFLPNKWVFPGGRLEPSDANVTPASGLAAGDAAALLHGLQPARTLAFATALAIAAVRELYEETGHALARPALKGEGLDDVWPGFRSCGLMPKLAPLRLIGRAITPAGRPRRYDTRFFFAEREDVIESVGPADGEFTDFGWFTLDDARRLDLPNITRRLLADFEGMLNASRGGVFGPVPFYYQHEGTFRRDLIPRL